MEMDTKKFSLELEPLEGSYLAALLMDHISEECESGFIARRLYHRIVDNLTAYADRLAS